MKNIWRIWCKALGEKQGTTKCEADAVALIRTAIVLATLTTNGFIIYGVLRTHVVPAQVPTPELYICYNSFSNQIKMTTRPCMLAL